MASRIRSPLRWYGGKHYIAPKLTKLFPTHRVYVESFFGGGSVLFAKTPVGVEIANDLNGEVVNFFRVLRSKPAELARRISLTPYARGEFEFCVENYGKAEDPVERARVFFFLCRASFSGVASSGKLTVGKFSTSVVERRGMSQKVSAFQGATESLIDVSGRLHRVLFENLDGVECIQKYDAEDVLHYVDPPYLPSVRDSSSRVEFGDLESSWDKHKELAEVLNSVRGMVVLSGYQSEEYLEWYKGWETHSWDVLCSASGTGTMRKLDESKPRRTEMAWLNSAAVRATQGG